MLTRVRKLTQWLALQSYSDTKRPEPRTGSHRRYGPRKEILSEKPAREKQFAARLGSVLAHPVVLLVVACVYLAPLVHSGWIPHDEGTLAQSAERVLHGELPHRDFDAMYTGGLSYLNALAFSIFGIKLTSIRTMFFLFTLAFVAVFHWLSRRLFSAGLAALTTYVAIVWSVPNYFAAMPSWYNLFFATFGIAAAVKFTENQSARWIVLAGLWGGVSILFKITGLYYVAAILLFLAFQAHCHEQTSVTFKWKYKWLSCALAISVSAIWLALVTSLVQSRMSPMVFAQLVLPSVIACGVWIDQSFRHPLCSRVQIRRLLISLSAFVGGVLAPLLTYALFFLANGGLKELGYGLFISPLTRLDGVTYPFPEGSIAVALVLGIGLLGILLVKSAKCDLVITYALLLLAALLLFFPLVFTRDVVFLLVRLAPPGFAIACGLRLVEHSPEMTRIQRQRLYLFLSMAACLPLIQFPFAAPIYFCFIVPVLLLQVQVLCTSLRSASLKSQWTASALLLFFGMFYLGTISFFDDPRLNAIDPPINKLDLPRGGLLVTERDKLVYEPLIKIIHQHSGPNEPILAFPDCPEVYFLSERRNPTRTLFDLFESRDKCHVDHLTAAEEGQTNVLVVNCESKHSQKLTTEQINRIQQRYEYCETIGPFLVCFNQ